MPILPTIRSFVRSLLAAPALDRELDEELQSYVDERTAHHRAHGLSDAAARRAALVEIGGVEQVKEQVRERRVGAGIETLWRDVRYGCRMIARAPGFAAVVVVTLALVIGANATVFGVLRAVLWKPLPYTDAERLVFVDADAGGAVSAGLSSAELTDLRAEPELFDQIGTVVSVDAHVRVGDHMERVAAASAHDDVLAAFGGDPPAYGRINDADGSLAAETAAFDPQGFVATVVISDDLWRRLLGADPAVVGRTIEVNNLDVRVVGVLRPEFRVFLPAVAGLPEVVDVWFPRPIDADRRSRGHATVGRLAPGVSLADARSRLEAIARRLTGDHAASYFDGPLRLHLAPLQDAVSADARPALVVLAAAVGFVLLIGCVNVGNLMLARARARAPEMALRRALGAGRGRLARQLATETAILVVAGAIAGFALAHAGVSLLEWLRPVHLPRQSQVAIDAPVALFTAAIAIGVCLVFGVLPTLWATRAGDTEPLRAGRAAVQRPGSRRLQRALVISEVALSIVPLVAAGLMLRTFVNLTQAPLGFDAGGLLTGKMALSRRAFNGPDRLLAVHRDAIERVRQLPGVDEVAAGGPLPFEGFAFHRTYGRPADPLPLVSRASVQSIFPGYLGIMRVPLRAGRDFTMDDLAGQRPVVIVDERIANELWPQGAIGQRLAVGRGRSSVLLEVIGVAGSIRMLSVRDDRTPHLFVPFPFQPFEMALLVRTQESAAALGPAIKQAVESAGTRRPFYNIQPMRWSIDRLTIRGSRCSS